MMKSHETASELFVWLFQLSSLFGRSESSVLYPSPGSQTL